jgi:hypothetical protein
MEVNDDNSPLRHGAAWDEAECKKLLQLIKKGKTIEEIAKEHNRSIGGINARLRHLAFDYYNKNYSIDDIEEITGLTKDVISATIARRTSVKEKKLIKKEATTTSSLSKNEEAINILNDIKTSIDMLIILLNK